MGASGKRVRHRGGLVVVTPGYAPIMAVRIVDLPESDRPRERLVRYGAANLSGTELIALVIGAGGSTGSALDVASQILSRWGSLDRLASVQIEDLLTLPSIGKAKAASLLAAFELGRKALMSSSAVDVISGPEDLALLVRPMLLGRPNEEVVLVVLNVANKPIRVLPFTRGGAEGCLISSRDVLSTVLRNDGVAFALAHNHPSGNPEPSSADIEMTEKMQEGAQAVGLRFLDHLIVTSSGHTSIKSKGFI